jgi:protein TonB
VAFGLGFGTGGSPAGQRRELLLALDSDPVTLPLPEEREPPAPIQVPEIPVEAPPPLPEEPPPRVEPEPFVEPEPPEEEAVCDLPAPRPAKVWLVRLQPPVATPAPQVPALAQALTELVPIAESNEPPRYPQLAIRQRLEGTAVIVVEVDGRGLVVRCSLDRSSGHGVLDRAALAALARWRFRGGPGTTRVPVVFRLTER